MTAIAQLPAHWTQCEPSDVERATGALVAATNGSARVCVSVRDVPDPRAALNASVIAAATRTRDTIAALTVSTRYLDVPAGRAVVAQLEVPEAVRVDGVAELWLPLPDRRVTVVVTVTTPVASCSGLAADLATEIGRRLRIDEPTRGPVCPPAGRSGYTVASTIGHRQPMSH